MDNFNYLEYRANTGNASVLMVNEDDPNNNTNPNNKYSLLIPLETVPSVFGTPESIEFSLTNSPVVGKIKGKITIDDKDIEFMLHRDNLYRLSKFEGKVLDLLYVTADGVGYKYIGEITVRPNDLTPSDPAKGTITLSCQSASTTPIWDVRNLVRPTVTITQSVPEQLTDAVTLDGTDVTIVTDVASSISASFTITDASGNTATNTDVFETATSPDTAGTKHTVTIKQKSALASNSNYAAGTYYGVCYITVYTSDNAQAPWTTTIRVKTVK